MTVARLTWCLDCHTPDEALLILTRRLRVSKIRHIRLVFASIKCRNHVRINDSPVASYNDEAMALDSRELSSDAGSRRRTVTAPLRVQLSTNDEFPGPTLSLVSVPTIVRSYNLQGKPRFFQAFTAPALML